MATSLAAQLSQIAANSSNSLNLRAQKAAHAQSLIFEPRVAASQSFDTIYVLCHEGFQELCLLDGRFLDFQRTIFSLQSQEEDRTQMTAAQNAELDKRLEAFLGLVGARLRLNPAIKAVEWLVRRFRVHEYNTNFLITTFLPYHTLPIFVTLLSILPAKKIPESYRFLHPYIRSLTPPTRHVIVYTAINSDAFSSLLNAYILRVANTRQEYPALLSFWAGVMTETISGMLEKSRSGRKGVQAQKEQDVILRLLPTLNEGLSMKSVPGLRIGCYMILSIITTKGSLDDKLLTAMMEAVVLGWSKDTLLPGLHCLSILAQERGPRQLTKRLAKELLKISDLPSLLLNISKQRRVDKLANGLCLALIGRASKTGNTESLPLVSHVIIENLLSDAQAAVMVKALLLAAHRIDDEVDADGSTRSQFARSLAALIDCPGHTGLLVQRVLEDTQTDMDELEMKLKATIRRKVIPAPAPEGVTMEDGNNSCPTAAQSFSTLFAGLLSGSGEDSSFLGLYDPERYDQMCKAFVASISSTEDLDRYDQSPMLRRDLALDKAVYLSFYIRIWCGPHPVLARTAALQMVARLLQRPERKLLDIQAIIPYALIALKDPAGKVRRAAAKLIMQLAKFYETGKDSKGEIFLTERWGSDSLYGEGEDKNAIKWLPADHVGRFVHDILIPALEECVLDKLHLDSVLDKALNGYKPPTETAKRGDQRRLSHTLRAAIVSCLASHAIITPVYLAKLRLLATLNQVRKVGSGTRTSVLLHLLQHWMALSPLQRQEICQNELIDLEEFENEAVTVIVPNDAAGLECMTSIIKGEVASDIPTLATAVFLRIRKMWPLLEGEMRVMTAQLLLDTALWPANEPGPNALIRSEAMDLIGTLDLSTDVLMSFLHQLPTASKLADKPPMTKRRRISHSETGRASIQDSKQLAGAIQKFTFVLQLIDGSNPRGHTALLGGLFNALAELQHFKTQVGSELGYLQVSVLSSLLSIVTTYKADRSQKLDRSAVRTDLLVDCVQKSTSPQVQNAALLLIASLADAAPELVLHSVMPIFTFMGSSVLRQNDDYSAHVIKQTIKEVIPPLIASLRKEKGNPVTGAAELLLSFVAAYEHVPTHRRKGLFTSLAQTLGAKDFLFALLAMLADKYGATSNIIAFVVDLSSGFDVDTQLQTALKIIDLIIDIRQPKPTVSSILLSSGESSTPEPHRVALIQLTQLLHLLSQRQLIEQTGSILERDDMDASRVRDLYTVLLEKILALAGTLDTAELHNVCGDVLESTLGLLSTSELAKAVESLLDRPNEELCRKILLSFQARIERESQSDEVSRLAMLNFLPQLTAIIRESQDVLYKHIAVSCVDKIAEKYGKKDLEAVAAAAHTIASEHCLGQGDRKLRVMALLCLASLVDILREGIVSVLPFAIPKTLDYMLESVEEENEDPKLHNAGYSLMGALVHHLPYMVSGPYLGRLLSISNKSAEAELDEIADESRIQCLQLTAKQIEAKNMFMALEENWKYAAVTGISSLREYLDVLSTAIDSHSKSIITKNSTLLSSIFFHAFDLRRQWSLSLTCEFTIEAMSEIESLVNHVALKMIYKFNDAAFRPIFMRLMEWASSGLPKDKAGQILRLQSIYAFLALFFGSLKSIVTSYATYVLENVVEILQNGNFKGSEARELWVRVLRTLCESFKHDQDDFWQSPAHFDVIMPTLNTQFQYAVTLPLTEELIPAMVELAAAADSADHHKQLNIAILKSMRSESASARLAAVKCEHALTDRLGEEWLSMLPEMLPFISELQDDDDEAVERETYRWVVKIEDVLGESLDSMLQ